MRRVSIWHLLIMDGNILGLKFKWSKEIEDRGAGDIAHFNR